MQLNNLATKVEHNFNIAGSIPIVGVISGGTRIFSGKIQILASLVFGGVGLTNQVFSDKEKWKNMTHAAGEHLIHGVLNVIRAIAEILLGVTVLGSLGLLAYQSSSETGFDPIISYSNTENPIENGVV